jgi:hypothetical protein
MLRGSIKWAAALVNRDNFVSRFQRYILIYAIPFQELNGEQGKLGGNKSGG